MKTLKLVLIAAILSFGMASMTAHSASKNIKVINLSLVQAVQEPGLVAVMYDNLTLDMLKVDKFGNYTAIVKYNRNLYRIYGSLPLWTRFFNSKPPVPINAGTIHRDQ